MTNFPSRPVLSPFFPADVVAAKSPRQLWYVEQDFRFQSDRYGFVVIVPKGFQTDLASVPKQINNILSCEDPRILFGSIVHDYGYSLSGMIPSNGQVIPVSRNTVDLALREAMIWAGADLFVADAVFEAVHLFGGTHWGTTALTRTTQL